MKIQKFILLSTLFFFIISYENKAQYLPFQTLTGHIKSVENIAFSNDGKYLASASRDKTFMLWNVVTAENVAVFKGHTDYLNAVCFSPDRKFVATASDDKTVRIWNMQKKELVHQLLGHNGWVYALDFSPDGKLLISGSWDNSLKLWNVKTGELVSTFTDHSHHINDVCFSPDGRYAISASSDKTLKMWNIQNEKLLRTYTGHKGKVNVVCFGANQNTFVSADNEGFIIFWNVDKQVPEKKFKAHNGAIRAIDFGYDGAFLVSEGNDKSIKIWNSSNGDLINRINHEYEINSIAISPDNTVLASAGRENEIYLWSFADILLETLPDTKKVQNRIESNVNTKPKTEFETKSDYAKRLYLAELEKLNIYNEYRQEVELLEKKRELARQHKIRDSYQKIEMKIENTGKYNADEQTFPVTINGQTKSVKIPVFEAESFKRNYTKATVEADKQLDETGEKYDIFNVNIYHPETFSRYSWGKRKSPLYVDYQITQSEIYNQQTGIPNLNTKIELIEPSGNNLLDANENANLQILVENTGKAPARNIRINMKLLTTEWQKYIEYQKQADIDYLPAGKSQKTYLKLSADGKLPTGELTYSITFTEESGFPPVPINISLSTQEFRPPNIEFIEAGIKENGNGNNIIERNEIIEVTALVQNKGFGKAEDVKAQIVIKDNNIISTTPAMLKQTLGDFEAGEAKTFQFSFVVNNNYEGNAILPIEIVLTEKWKKYGGSFPLGLEMEKISLVSKDIKIDGEYIKNLKIVDASLRSDVDKNIPENPVNQFNTYALIIGNEDYSTFQTDLSSEVNVDYAENDARIFNGYIVKTLGVPEKNTKLIINGTTAKIQRGISWLQNLSELENGKAELIFYYSGHGLPHEKTREAYIIPVDVSGKNLEAAIKLDDVYRKLTEHPAKRVSVFLDACFSGGARNQGLLAMKSVRIKPKKGYLSGNLVVFASSSGNESSAVYRDKHHGFFTYFLLKKWQDSKGDLTYKELADYLTSNVSKEALLIEEKIQTPEILVSPKVEKEWGNWRFLK